MKIFVTPQFGIGDTLLFTPALQYLKDNLEVHITVLTMFKTTHSVLLYNPNIDELKYYPFLERKKFEGILYLLREERGKYDVSINFYPSNRSHYNLFAFFIGAKKRLGHRYLEDDVKNLNFLKNLTLKESINLHVQEQNLKLAALLTGKEPDYEKYKKLQYFESEEEREFAEKWLRKHHVGGFLVGIHPGSSTFKNHINKRWPKEKFSQFVNSILQDDREISVLIFGGSEDEDAKTYIEEKAVDKRRTIAVRGTTLRQTASIIKMVNIFVTNDTGLMHLAAALETPIVLITGPTNPLWVRPLGVKHRLVYMGLHCSPCFYHSPRPLKCVRGRNFECLRDLPVEFVRNAFYSLKREIS